MINPLLIQTFAYGFHLGGIVIYAIISKKVKNMPELTYMDYALIGINAGLLSCSYIRTRRSLKL